MKKQKDVVTLRLHRRSGTVIQDWILNTVVTNKRDGTVVWGFPRKSLHRYTWTNKKGREVLVAGATLQSEMLSGALSGHRCQLGQVRDVFVRPGGSLTLEFGPGEPVMIVR